MEETAPPFDPIRHRRGGRPRKTDAERRDSRVLVRMSSQERDAAKTRIANTGLSLSEFVRQAFAGSVEIVTAQVAPPELLRQLRVMNNHMNQLLREARRSPVEMPALEAVTIDAMETVNAELRSLIHGPQC